MCECDCIKLLLTYLLTLTSCRGRQTKTE